MTTSSVTGQTTARTQADSFGPGPDQVVYPAKGSKSPSRREPQKMVAEYLNPGCEHDWFKLDDHLQTLASEGKIIWQCRTCAEVTNTYDWRTP